LFTRRYFKYFKLLNYAKNICKLVRLIRHKIAIKIRELLSYQRLKIFKEEIRVVSFPRIPCSISFKKQAISLVHSLNFMSMTPVHGSVRSESRGTVLVIMKHHKVLCSVL